jgi:hypothetical protein
LYQNKPMGTEFFIPDNVYADDPSIYWLCREDLEKEGPRCVEHFASFGPDMQRATSAPAASGKKSKTECLFCSASPAAYADPSTYDGADLSDSDMGNGKSIQVVFRCPSLGTTISGDSSCEPEISREELVSPVYNPHFQGTHTHAPTRTAVSKCSLNIASVTKDKRQIQIHRQQRLNRSNSRNWLRAVRSVAKDKSKSWGEVSPFDKDESLVLNLDAMRQILGTKGMEAVRDVAAWTPPASASHSGAGVRDDAASVIIRPDEPSMQQLEKMQEIVEHRDALTLAAEQLAQLTKDICIRAPHTTAPQDLLLLDWPIHIVAVKKGANTQVPIKVQHGGVVLWRILTKTKDISLCVKLGETTAFGPARTKGEKWTTKGHLRPPPPLPPPIHIS